MKFECYGCGELVSEKEAILKVTDTFEGFYRHASALCPYCKKCWKARE